MANNQDQYDVVRPIGSGAFGQVYLVVHKVEQQYYVMKEIAALATLDEKQRESTELEVELLGSMSHPNIVGYRDSFVNNQGNLAIYMEYCEHGDMSTYLLETKKVGKMPGEAKVLEWFVQIVLALHALHVKKILHRDLKTQNIFLTGASTHATVSPRQHHTFALKLGDFGIAKVLNSTTDFAMTQIGTPFYMSPELFNNKPYGYKSDVWGLGCVLYEVVNGQRPFEGQSINGLALKVLQGRYTPITATCSEESKSLIKSMLSTNPAHRPTLQEVLSNPSIRRRIPPALQTVISAGTPEAKPQIEAILKGQLTSLGLGAVVNNPGGPGPRRDRRHLLQKLERAERRRKREEDALKRLQETARLLAQYIKESSSGHATSRAHPHFMTAPLIDLDESDELEPLQFTPAFHDYGAHPGSMAHTSSDSAVPRVARVDIPSDLPFAEDQTAPMSHRDRVLLRKEQRREEEHQRFEEEARKIRQENLAYQRAWVQDSREQWGQPLATAHAHTSGFSQHSRIAPKDATSFQPSTTASSYHQDQAPPPPPLGAKPLAPLLGYEHIKPVNLAHPFQSCHPNVVNSPRKRSLADPQPPRPQYGHRQEPHPPHEAPHHSAARWTHFSRSDQAFQTTRSLHSVCLEALSSDGFDRLPEPSDDSGQESDDAFSDVGGKSLGTDEQVRRQSLIVQQRINACCAAIYRHKMTIDTLQYNFAQEGQEGQDQHWAQTYGDGMQHQDRTGSDFFVADAAITSQDGRRRHGAPPAIVQDRITRLKRRCLEGLGNEVFQDARQRLQSLLDSGVVGEAVRREMLEKLGLEKIGFYSLIDQIVYMEWQWGAQELA